VTLLTENPNPSSISLTSGDGQYPGGMAVLDSEIYRDMRWCANCGGRRVMIDVFEFEGGRMEACQGCGEEKVRYTRSHSQ
jgi:hypothetical protein